MSLFEVKLPQFDKKLNGSEETSLLSFFANNGINIYSPCGGKGYCGKCKVKVSGNINSVTPEENNCLSQAEISKGIRLACRVYVKDKAVVYLLENELINNIKEKISLTKDYSLNSEINKLYISPTCPTLENSLSTIDGIKKVLGDIRINSEVLKQISEMECSLYQTYTLYNNELIDVESIDTTDSKYGVAVDIGTTTIACYLVDLNVGRQIAVKSIQNPQTAYGGDLITRINYCLEKDQGVYHLTNLINEAINNLILKLSIQENIKHRHIYKCVLVGNTVMNHLFLELNPKTLSSIPFNPITKDMVVMDAKNSYMKNINKNAKVIFLPNIGSFVGSDITAGIVAAELDENKGKELLIDWGTNGEVVLFTPQGKYACSTAAGPAFEGRGIKHGMQAFSGAIDSTWISDDLYYTTIDGMAAKGICGSGLLSIMSDFIDEGLIQKNGYIADPEKIKNAKLKKRILGEGGKKEIIIAFPQETYSSETITISQKDVREIQLAKAAVRCGISILTKTANLDFNKIDKVLLTGAFGNFIIKENAVKIGLFPENIDPEKIISFGNAAGEGAKMALCDKNILNERIFKSLPEIKHFNISTHPDFLEEYVSSIDFQEEYAKAMFFR